MRGTTYSSLPEGHLTRSPFGRILGRIEQLGWRAT